MCFLNSLLNVTSIRTSNIQIAIRYMYYALYRLFVSQTPRSIFFAYRLSDGHLGGSGTIHKIPHLSIINNELTSET